MDKLVPWVEFCAVIEPFYPKVGNGKPPLRLERMLRMYFIANWFNLADEACEDALYDIVAFRDFCRIDLGCEGVPDATSLLGFRHLLEEHKLGPPSRMPLSLRPRVPRRTPTGCATPRCIRPRRATSGTLRQTQDRLWHEGAYRSGQQERSGS